METPDQSILDFICQGETASTEHAFSCLALRVFEHQFENNPVYRRFCEQRGCRPGRIGRWEEIPAVPTDAFRAVDFRSFLAEKTLRTFVSSGTTRESRSRHHFDTLALYEASLLPNFARHLLPDRARLPMLSLTPSAACQPESSLYFMIDRMMREWGAAGSDTFIRPDGVFETEKLAAALEASERQNQPVMLLGAAFSFVHFLDWLSKQNRRFHLPPGSRLMETGGYKGRSREVPKEELLELLEHWLGVPSSHVVNEYGMTELSVQFYDQTLSEASLGRSPRRVKSIPHWARVQILNPETLSPAAEGEVGIIQVCDLSNRGSCIQIMTADLGRKIGNGFDIIGRASGAEARGCSLTLDEMLRIEGLKD